MVETTGSFPKMLHGLRKEPVAATRPLIEATPAKDASAFGEPPKGKQRAFGHQGGKAFGKK